MTDAMKCISMIVPARVCVCERWSFEAELPFGASMRETIKEREKIHCVCSCPCGMGRQEPPAAALWRHILSPSYTTSSCLLLLLDVSSVYEEQDRPIAKTHSFEKKSHSYTPFSTGNLTNRHSTIDYYGYKTIIWLLLVLWQVRGLCLYCISSRRMRHESALVGVVRCVVW
jgi:hypothetical protein